MLKNISPILSPGLLRALRIMGHGDEIVIADGNYSAAADAKHNPVIQLRGYSVEQVLEAILHVMPLDDKDLDGPCAHIITENGTQEGIPYLRLGRMIQGSYNLDHGLELGADVACAIPVDRAEFHARACKAQFIVATDDPTHYACIILRMGALPEPKKPIDDMPSEIGARAG